MSGTLKYRNVQVVEREKLITVQSEEHSVRMECKEQSWQARISGWKCGICFGIIAISAVFSLNIIILIIVKVRYNSLDGVIELYSGDCSKVDKLKIGTHLAINALATGLLSASNYAMQVLSAPTRREIDLAHSKRKWLDIGLPSLRNLPSIAWSRLLVWSGLLLSSLPLHLIYNSVVFTSFTAYEYNVLIVAPEFLKGGSTTDYATMDMYYYDNGAYNSLAPTDDDVNTIRTDLSSFVRLPKSECIATYAEPFRTSNSDLVVVTTVHNNTESLYIAIRDGNLFMASGAVARWMCMQPNYVQSKCEVNDPNSLPNPATWQLWDYPVDYCLSRVVTPQCKLSFSTTLMVIVIIANAAKLICMTAALFSVNGDALVTIGDAIASFMEKPDGTTQGRCLMGKKQINSWTQMQEDRTQPMQYKPKRIFWIQNIGSGRMWLSCLLIAAGTIVAVVLMSRGILGLALDGITLQTIYKLGFGKAKSQAYWNGGPTGLLANVILTNMPQVIFSAMYLAYNGLYTAMLIAAEWSSYPNQRRPLRVSHAKGQQRTTYFLQVPYWYALPLITVSAVVHWVISQSFFVLAVDFTSRDHRNDSSVVAAGYSVLAIIIAFAIGILLVITFVLVGLRRLPGKIPSAGACSAAISAACHCHAESADPTMEVMWGATRSAHGQGGQYAHGHCSFTNEQVSEPVEDEWYAGLSG